VCESIAHSAATHDVRPATKQKSSHNGSHVANILLFLLYTPRYTVYIMYVEIHDGGERQGMIDGITTTIYYNKNSHSQMI